MFLKVFLSISNTLHYSCWSAFSAQYILLWYLYAAFSQSRSIYLIKSASACAFYLHLYTTPDGCWCYSATISIYNHLVEYLKIGAEVLSLSRRALLLSKAAAAGL